MDKLTPIEIKEILDDLIDEALNELCSLEIKLKHEEDCEDYEKANEVNQLIELTITQAGNIYSTLTDEDSEDFVKRLNFCKSKIREKIRK
jgi:hypothetical protein